MTNTAADALQALESRILAAPASAGQIVLTAGETQLIRSALVLAISATLPAVPAGNPLSLAALQKEIDEKIQSYQSRE